MKSAPLTATATVHAATSTVSFKYGNVDLKSPVSDFGSATAPAVGRAVSEIIIDSRFVSLDLSRFRFSRFEEGQLVHENNVI